MRLFLTGLFAMLTLSAAAQGISVKGSVVDSSGVPVIGANVMVQGTTNGASTDLDGNFTLTNVAPNSVIEVSFIGYKTEEFVAVPSQTFFSVTLSEETAALDEVVVVGYGVQMKSHLTGSISKIDGSILSDRPASDLTTALQGQIAGLSINNTTSEVGVAPSIRVRGTGSISADSGPLVIIDGYPVPDGLQSLNPSDVQSIEILKDAASAAIYGSRAANGVIMVTTKSGSAEKARYSVKFYQGVKYAYQLHDMLTQTEYLELQQREYAQGWNEAPKQQDMAAAWVEKNIGSTNWQREGLRDVASTTNVQFSVQGGKRDIRYYSSASWTRDQGIMLQNEMQKVTFRSRLDANLSRIVKYGVNMSATYIKGERPRNNFIDFYRTPSFLPVTHNAWTTALTGYTGFARGSHFNSMFAPIGDPDENGNPTWNASGVSPFSSANNNPKSVMANTERWNESFQGLANAYLTVDICKGLQFKTSNGVNVRYRPSYSYNNVNATKDGEASSATFNSQLYIDMLTENTLTYARRFGRHDLNVLAGYTAESTRVQNVALAASGFPTDNIHTLNAATIFELASSNNGNGSGTGTFRYPDKILESYLGRVTYGYDDRYLLSASIRLDRSSLFAPGNRNAWFSSASLGWRISEEKFMRNQRVFSNLKLRASYGVTGNNNVDYNAALEVLNPANYPLGKSESLIPGAANTSSSLANSNITWEQTDEFNFGLDAAFVDNRIQLTVDGYYSVTRALLFEQPTQSFTGFQSFWNNIGKVRNAGVEIQLDTYQFKRKHFEWSTSLNFGLTRNKLLEIGGESQMISQGERSENYLARVGDPLIQYYGFKSIGVWNSQEEIDANPHRSGDVPGGLRLYDANGDGVVNDADRVALGNPYPDFTWGMTNNFRIHDFDISFQLQGVQGITVFNGDIFYNETHKYNRAYLKNRWESPEFPGDGKTPHGKTGVDIMLTDLPLQNGSYMCLRNVTLGYTLPRRYAAKAGLSSLRVYVTGTNLLYIWSSDYKGVNPESRYTSSQYSSPMIDGYQRGGFPLTSSVTFGLDFNF